MTAKVANAEQKATRDNYAPSNVECQSETVDCKSFGTLISKVVVGVESVWRGSDLAGSV